MARTCVIQCNLKNFPFGADSLPAEACRLFRSSGIRSTTDYGWMLYLIQYPNKTKKGINYKSGDVYPLFYHPILKHGIVNVDEYPVSRRIA